MEVARIAIPSRSVALLCRFTETDDLKYAIRRLRSRAEIQQMRSNRILREELADVAYFRTAVTYTPPALDYLVSNYDEATGLLIIHEFEAESDWFGDFDLRLHDRADYLLMVSARPNFVYRDDGARIAVDASRTSTVMVENEVHPVVKIYSAQQEPDPRLYQDVATYRLALVQHHLALVSPDRMPFIEEVVRYHVQKLHEVFMDGQGQKRLP